MGNILYALLPAILIWLRDDVLAVASTLDHLTLSAVAKLIAVLQFLA